jgi:hypothetical protein
MCGLSYLYIDLDMERRKTVYAILFLAPRGVIFVSMSKIDLYVHVWVILHNVHLHMRPRAQMASRFKSVGSLRFPPSLRCPLQFGDVAKRA